MLIKCLFWRLDLRAQNLASNLWVSHKILSPDDSVFKQLKFMLPRLLQVPIYPIVLPCPLLFLLATLLRFFESRASSKVRAFQTWTNQFFPDSISLIIILCIFLSLSIHLSSFRIHCKRTEVPPILKRGHTRDANSRISEVFEFFISDQLLPFLECEGLLSDG